MLNELINNESSPGNLTLGQCQEGNQGRGFVRHYVNI